MKKMAWLGSGNLVLVFGFGFCFVSGFRRREEVEEEEDDDDGGENGRIRG